MAQYKVIQDVEAEDKLLGPLTLRQFIYAFIAGVLIFMSYFSIAKGAGFMVIFFIPPAAVAVFFAFPWSHEQSTEVWALARIGFLFKPRKRIWDQSGFKELVTVTAPKRLEQLYTDGLSQGEVQSRLNALASTLDSRGWAVKNSASPHAYTAAADNADRLVDAASIPNEVSVFGDENFTDMLDPSGNTVAQQFDTLLSSQSKTHHQKLVTSYQQTTPPPIVADASSSPTTTNTPPGATPPEDFWFMNDQNTSSAAGTPTTPLITPSQNVSNPVVSTASIPVDDEAALVETLKQHETTNTYEYSHLPKILPLAEREKLEKQQAEEQAAKAAADAAVAMQNSTSTMTDTHDAAILGYASNNDLSVETIARQAKKTRQIDDDEVVISLH